MSAKSLKQRFKRAIIAAEKTLTYPPGSARVIILQNHIFQIEAIRKKEIRKIRIVLDEMKKSDEEIVNAYELPSNCTKEIWCRLKNGKFIIKRLFD
jgi:hypothetical protein